MIRNMMWSGKKGRGEKDKVKINMKEEYMEDFLNRLRQLDTTLSLIHI